MMSVHRYSAAPPLATAVPMVETAKLSTCAEIFTDWVTVFEWFQRLFSVINFAYLLNPR